MPRKKSEDGSRTRGKRDSKFEFRNPGNKRQARAIRSGEGIQPSAKDVALAVIGGHITREEARANNRHYNQWIPEGTKIPRKKAEPKPKKGKTKKVKKAPVKPSKILSTEKRVVNGKMYTVTNLAPIQRRNRRRKPQQGKGKAV